MNTTSTSSSYIDRLQFFTIDLWNILIHPMFHSYNSFFWFFQHVSPSFLAKISQIQARRAFFNTYRNVPAYTKYISHSGLVEGFIPETDKETYIKRYSPESRCLGGRILSPKVMIDESSGSTGTPYNWIRSKKERQQSQQFVSFFARYCYGAKPLISINAFSMGAWATGVNMGEALLQNGIVKNTGPDIPKILNTLSFFGPNYPYLIIGYPPFLKHLIDVAKAQGFPWESYKIDALVGGEGMSEGLRDYLMGSFQKIFSGYGATDLEIGIAGETPLSMALRRLARDNFKVREILFSEDSRLPMLFQYNPLMYFIEVNNNREVVFTITRTSLLSPRIRYNIHDEGGIASFNEIAQKLSCVGYDINSLIQQTDSTCLKLPFLWIYGRRDFTISVMGANIYPEDIEQCVYADPNLARLTRSFCQTLSESTGAEVRPCFHFEVYEEPSTEMAAQFSENILNNLVKINADFREAWHEYPETMVPEVKLHRLGEGPFKSDIGRIKQVRKLN